MKIRAIFRHRQPEDAKNAKTSHFLHLIVCQTFINNDGFYALQFTGKNAAFRP